MIKSEVRGTGSDGLALQLKQLKRSSDERINNPYPNEQLNPSERINPNPYQLAKFWNALPVTLSVPLS